MTKGHLLALLLTIPWWLQAIYFAHLAAAETFDDTPADMYSGLEFLVIVAGVLHVLGVMVAIAYRSWSQRRSRTPSG